MTLIDGGKIVTAQLYDDEYEEFKEEKMSIIDYVNAYTDEGVTIADDVLDNIRVEILKISSYNGFELGGFKDGYTSAMARVLKIIDNYKYKAESEDSIYKKMEEIDLGEIGLTAEMIGVEKDSE